MPVSSPPVRDGAVLVEDGRIRSVGPLSEVGRENPDAEVRFFPNYVHGPRRRQRPRPPRVQAEGQARGRHVRGLAEQAHRTPPGEGEPGLPRPPATRPGKPWRRGRRTWPSHRPTGNACRSSPKAAWRGPSSPSSSRTRSAPRRRRSSSSSGKARELREGLPERVNASVSVHSPYTVDPESSRLAARRTREMGWKLGDPPLREPRGGRVREVVVLVASPTSSARNEWGGVGVSPVRYARDIELLAPETIAAHLATASLRGRYRDSGADRRVRRRIVRAPTITLAAASRRCRA